jgi:hypothetical protein
MQDRRKAGRHAEGVRVGQKLLVEFGVHLDGLSEIGGFADQPPRVSHEVARS